MKTTRLPGHWPTATLALAAAAALAVLTPSAASAAPPEPIDTTFSFVADDMCVFPVTWTVHTIEQLRTEDTGSGSIQIDNVLETDRIDANGKTIQGLPYHYMTRFELDANGNVTALHAQGEYFKFLAPDGRTVTVAGRANWLTEGWNGTPNKDEWAWACSALAP